LTPASSPENKPYQKAAHQKETLKPLVDGNENRHSERFSYLARHYNKDSAEK
jgi:hypothetical protein